MNTYPRPRLTFTAGITGLFLILLATTVLSAPEGIVYQGRLTDTIGEPLDGTFNLNFSIFTEATGGSLLWGEDILNVTVTDGLFKVTLGEGTAFSPTIFHVDGVYLAIRVNGAAELSPRQKLASVPAAKVVETISGSSGGAISGGLSMESSLIVGSGNLVHSTASAAIGQDNTATGLLSSVTGGHDNIADGPQSHIGGGGGNNANGEFSTVSGGDRNTASTRFATVAGGQLNAVSERSATIGGGYANFADGLGSFIGGGEFNDATANFSLVVGGSGNEAYGTASSVVGGIGNDCLSHYSHIGGGANNTCNGDYGAVICGYANSAVGSYNVILGGNDCGISPGQIISSSYCMVFGDHVDLRGAVRVVGLFDGANHGRLALNRDSDDGSISHPIHVGTNSNNGNGAHLTSGGVWTNASSRKFKENYTPLDQQQLFDAIESLDIEGWNYRSSSERHIGPYAEEFVEAFNVGTFDEETGERVKSHLAAGDVAGVALAGTKELIIENRTLKQRVSQLESELLKIKNLLQMQAQLSPANASN